MHGPSKTIQSKSESLDSELPSKTKQNQNYKSTWKMKMSELGNTVWFIFP